MIPGSFSLKDKRKVLQSIINRIKHRFNVSIAEVDHHELWQRSKLGITAVGNEKKYINSLIDRILNFIHNTTTIEAINTEIDFIKY